ncbi:MAG: hypothetical protein ACLFUR_06600 [Candidatus Hadarchaeia archaeon]
MERRAVLDTSAIVTLFSALDLKEKTLGNFEIVVPECVEKELEEFAEHDDYLGNRGGKALEATVVKNNPLSKKELEKERNSMGLGQEGITDCDVQALHLSFNQDLPFFTDDFSAHRHFKSQYPSKNLFFGIVLTLDILKFDVASKAEEFVFEKLVPKRFPEATDRTKSNLKLAIDEFLSKK